jgi:hypothetical protein
MKIQPEIGKTVASFFEVPNLLITPIQAGKTLGYKPQTVYNMVHLGTFPVPMVEIRSRQMVRMVDLIDYVSSLKPTIPSNSNQITPIIPEKRRRGAPTKAELAVRAAAKSLAGV